MKINNKILTVLLLVIMLLALNSVSAADNSTNQQSDSIISDTPSTSGNSTIESLSTNNKIINSAESQTSSSISSISHDSNYNSQENSKDIVSNVKNDNVNSVVVEDNSNENKLSRDSSSVKEDTTEQTTTVKNTSIKNKEIYLSDNVTDTQNLVVSTGSSAQSSNTSTKDTYTVNNNSVIVASDVLNTTVVKQSVKTLKSSSEYTVTVSNYADLKKYAEKTDGNYIITMTSGIYAPTSTINIGNNVTIIGDGSVIIGSSSSNILWNIQSLFNVGTNTLNITNITFANMNAGTSSFYVIKSKASSKLYITNCLFENITTYTYGSGVIINADSVEASITNTTFKGITTAYGVICSSNNMTIKDSSFINNIGNTYSASVYVTGGNLSVINTLFKGNSLNTWNSGSAAIYNVNGNVVVTDSTIDSNSKTGNYGGAIYNSNGNLTLKNTIINNNSAVCYGGAIYQYKGNLTLIGVTLSNNTASQKAGAIYNAYGNVIITDSTVYNNKAGEEAGVIYNSLGNVTITDSMFNNNTASQDGGVIYNNGILNIANVEFRNSTSTSQSGGVIATTGGNISMNNATFINSTAAGNNGGGVIYAQNTGITINNVNFINNKEKSNDGGVVWIKEGSLIIGNSTITNSSSAGSSGGGVIYAKNTPVTLDNVNVSNSISHTNDGGVIYVIGNTLTITNSNFNNSTGRYGGVVFANNNAKVTIKNTVMNGSTQDYIGNHPGEGGTIWITGGSLDISDSVINNSATSQYGGGIYAASTTLTVNNVDFNNCSAIGTSYSAGGAIYTTSGTISVVDSRISNSVASNMGGAIYDDNTKSVIIAYNNFTNISANTETLASPGANSRDIHNNTFYNCSMAKNKVQINAQDYAALNELVNVNITVGLQYPEYYDPDISNKTDLYSDCKFDVYFTTANSKWNPVFNYTTTVGVHNYTIPASYVGTIQTYVRFNSTWTQSNTEYITVEEKAEPTKTIITLDPIADNYTLTNILITAHVKDQNGNDVVSGNITITDGNGNSIIVPVNNGVATTTVNYTYKGEYTVTATYNDTTGTYQNNTNKTTVKITPIPTTTTITDPVIMKINETTTISVVVRDKNGDLVKSGNVTFVNGNGETKTVNVVDGIATYNNVNYTNEGTYPITATYNGDDTYKTSNNQTTVTTNKYNTTIITSPIQSTTTTPTTVTVTVKDETGKTVTTGNVTFTDETGKIIGTVSVNPDGTATVPYTAETKGNYTITVTYTDSTGKYNNSNNTVNVEIVPTEVKIISNNTAGTVGTPVDVTITVKDVNGKTVTTGTVTFTDETGKIIGTATVNPDGTATVPYTAETKGDKTFNVSYTDSTGKYNDSTGNTYVNIASIPTTTITTDVKNCIAGNVVKINATVKDNNGNLVTTGNVTFTYKNGATQTVEVINGYAITKSIRYINTGSDVVNVSYTDNSGKYSDSKNTTTVYTTAGGAYVNATVIDPTPATGNTISNTALTVNLYDGFMKNVTTGTVTFYDENGTKLGTATVENGVATISYLFDKKGSYNIIVKYTDTSGNYPDVTGSLTATIKAVDTNIVLSPTNGKVNDNLKVTATVTDVYGNIIQSGTVTFTDGNGNTIETVNIKDGVATTTVTYGANGLYDIKAIYSGNETYNGNSNSTIVTITPIGTNLVILPISNTTLTNNTITVHVTDENGNNIQSGTVAINLGNGTTVYADITNGVATTVVNYNTKGDYTLTATYNGNGTYSGNTNISTATITPIGTTTIISPMNNNYTINTNIQINATVTDANGDKVQSGSAIFTDNHGLTKTVNVVNGIATVTVNYDTIGDYTISVEYKGDNTYNPSNCDLTKIDLVEGVVPIDDGTHTGGNSTEEDGHADNTITDTPSTDTPTTDNVVSDNTSTTETTTTITDTPTTDATTTTTVTDDTNNNHNNQNTITENPTENNTAATTITEDTTTTTPINNTVIDDTPTTGNGTVIDDTPTIDTPTTGNSTVIDDTPRNDTPVKDNTSTDIIDVDTPKNNNTVDTENTTTPTDTPTDTNTTTDANTTDIINNNVNTNTTVNPSNTTETTNNTEVTPDVTKPTTDVTENATVITTDNQNATVITPASQNETATATTPATATTGQNATTPTTATTGQTATATTPATATVGQTATVTTPATATTGQTATATSDNNVNDNTGITDTGASDNGATDQSSNATDNGNNNVVSEDSGISLTSYNTIQRRVKLRSFFTAD